jgi:Zn-dependent peptidase ImmA (M78 family)
MDDWQADGHRIEREADNFAANLLTPLDDFRKQISNTVDFEQLSACANRYGVFNTVFSTVRSTRQMLSQIRNATARGRHCGNGQAG